MRQRFTICLAEEPQLVRWVRHIFDCASIFDLTSAVFRFQTSSKVQSLTGVSIALTPGQEVLLGKLLLHVA